MPSAWRQGWTHGPRYAAKLEEVGKGILMLAVLLLGASCGASLDGVQRDVARCQAQPLQSALAHDQSWVREYAARGLGRCRIAEARSALEARAGDPAETRWVRAAAAASLSRLPPAPSTIDLLAGLAAEPREEPELRVAAIQALEGAAAENPQACDVLAAAVAASDILVSAKAQVAVAKACRCEEDAPCAGN